MAKVLQQTTVTHVDHTSGEVTSEQSTTVVAFPTEPPYIKMYIDDLCHLAGVSNADQSVLHLMLMKLDYEGYIFLSPRFRAHICDSLGITPKTLRNRLSGLVKAEIIKSEYKSEYQVNPNYFARGDWRNVVEQRKAFSVTTTYDPVKGRVSELVIKK